MARTRIQKILAEAGVASRRAVEEMIVQGRVTVNDQLVNELPCFINPDADRVAVDGRLIRTSTGPKRYVLLNKARDVVCTSGDEMGRRRAIDCIPPTGQRLYCVGRLDSDSTGLILLTNDGDLTHYLTHPSYGVIKTYVALIDGHLTAEKIGRLKKGVWLDGRPTAGSMIRVLKRAGGTTLLEIRLTEGRNREIRRVLARLGHKVRRLHRKAIGPINDRGLKVGSFRELSDAEVAGLRQAGGFVPRNAPPAAAAEPNPRPAYTPNARAKSVSLSAGKSRHKRPKTDPGRQGKPSGTRLSKAHPAKRSAKPHRPPNKTNRRRR